MILDIRSKRTNLKTKIESLFIQYNNYMLHKKEENQSGENWWDFFFQK